MNLQASVFCAVLAAVFPVLHAQAQTAPAGAPGRIAFVSTERILRDSAPAMRAQKKLEGEFKKRDDELAKIADQLKRMQEELDKNSVTMSETQRRNKEREFGDLNSDFKRKQR